MLLNTGCDPFWFLTCRKKWISQKKQKYEHTTTPTHPTKIKKETHTHTQINQQKQTQTQINTHKYTNKNTNSKNLIFLKLIMTQPWSWIHPYGSLKPVRQPLGSDVPMHHIYLDTAWKLSEGGLDETGVIKLWRDETLQKDGKFEGIPL